MGASDFSKLPHIGESLKRKEDYRFLTGAGQYTDDVVLAAQSHAVFVRSPHAHAKINSINVEAAKAAPGQPQQLRNQAPRRAFIALDRLGQVDSALAFHRVDDFRCVSHCALLAAL